MASPLDPPDGNWWDNPVNRREALWMGIAGAWSLGIFGWMTGFTRFGNQNPVGDTYDVDPDEFQDTVDAYKDSASEIEVRTTDGQPDIVEGATEDDDTESAIIPPANSAYIIGQRFIWDGLPVVLEAGTEYDIHLSSYDVQHGFSVRPEDSLSQQINLQVLPGTEWVIPMTFDDPGVYHVICNEFCGVGHRRMHGKFYVMEEL